MPEIDDWIHPLDLLAKREPLDKAAAQVVVIASAVDAGSSSVGRGLVKLLEQRGRVASFEVVGNDPSLGESLNIAARSSEHSLMLITSATQVWSLAHLDPLLKAIDSKDHVVGRRPLPIAGRLLRWVKHLPDRFLFASPVLDIHSPCRLHRRDALRAMTLQSKTSFVDCEWIAKATYLKQLIDEVPIPPMNALADPRSTSEDRRLVWSRPEFLSIKTT